MNKASLIDSIVEQTGVNRKSVELIIDSMLDTITKSLRGGEAVNLTGFGKFSARTRSARMGVDPQNPSQRIQIPTVTVPKFKSGKALKDALKHSGSNTATKDDTTEPEPSAEA